MVNRREPYPLPQKETAVLSRDTEIRPDDPLRSHPSQTDDHLRPKKQRLIFQIRDTRLLFLRFRIPISRRMALDSVQNQAASDMPPSFGTPHYTALR